ncbi:MAG: hypothetical protein CL565_06025 [Alphaproteobacteria bacterium]|nr:hypothetical protein [Alphaproteobacteria bacterium]
MRISKYFTKKRSLTGLLVIVTLVFIGMLAEAIFDSYEEYKEKVAFSQLAPDFISMCLKDAEDRGNNDVILGRIRQCVHNNSVHNIDEEFYQHWRAPTSDKLRRILDFANGDMPEPPHMECSTRTEVLEDLYRYMGYQTKVYNVVQAADDFPGHILVEVFNPTTKEGELHDPTYNVSYNNFETGKRLNAIEVLETPLNEIAYCGNAGNCSQEEMREDEALVSDKIRDYFGFFYHKPDTGNEDGILSINKSRFDPEEKFSVKGEQMTYCEKKAKNCQNPIQFYKERTEITDL